jgi:3-hydroxyisobutyrate dehydrogenase-like beta-hydroxyacid dehydrogenase
MTKPRIGIIGLGRIGAPLAIRAVQAGFEVVVCRRGRSDEVVAKGATMAGDGAVFDVASDAEVVVTCMPSLRALEDVITGDGGLAHCSAPPLVVDATTCTLDGKSRLRDALVTAGSDMLDCPVSGTSAMVEAGAAVIYASGEASALKWVEPLLGALSPSYVTVGDFGAGTRMKCVANTLVLIHLIATAEAMAYAEAIGLEPHRVVEIAGASPAATSGQFKVWAPLIADYRFDGTLGNVNMGFEVLDLIRSEAERVGAVMPLLDVVERVWGEMAEQGLGESAPTSLAKLLLARANRPSAG